MDALLLAAGYGTRLRPLTDHTPKSLLEVGGRPVLEYTMEPLEGDDRIERLYLVTNDRFVGRFRRWARGRTAGKPLTIVNDGTASNEERLGAIADIRYVLRKTDIHPAGGLYVCGTDNLAPFDITAVLDVARSCRCSAVFACRIGDPQRLLRMGVVKLDAEDRVVDFQEKPDEPPSDLAVPPFYCYCTEAVKLLGRYLDEGRDPDAPGNFLSWLVHRTPVYARRVDRATYDIGTPESYEAVRRKFDG